MPKKKAQEQKPFADRFPTRESEILDVLADNVRDLRAECQLSQHELANTTKIQQTEISKIENRRANPTILTLQRLADAFGVPLPAMLEPEAKQRRKRHLARDLT
jgi:transcriptional regulator with XRE-family HTH domain